MADIHVSIIVPVLNETAGIETVLTTLQRWRRKGHEVLVVDGGSIDNTVERATALADCVLSTLPGRARQMNAGAANASHDVLLFLHSDTLLPTDGLEHIKRAVLSGAQWGHFRLRLSGPGVSLRVIERATNLRTAWTSVVTGDMALFVKRDLFAMVEGFADLPLMEDVAISKRLRRLARRHRLPTHVVSSSRRWEEKGALRTVLLMWRLRLAYFLGVDPQRLARVYYPEQPTKRQS